MINAAWKSAQAD